MDVLSFVTVEFVFLPSSAFFSDHHSSILSGKNVYSCWVQDAYSRFEVSGWLCQWSLQTLFSSKEYFNQTVCLRKCSGFLIWGNVKQLKWMEGDRCVPYLPHAAQLFPNFYCFHFIAPSLQPLCSLSLLLSDTAEAASRQLEEEEPWKAILLHLPTFQSG